MLIRRAMPEDLPQLLCLYEEVRRQRRNVASPERLPDVHPDPRRLEREQRCGCSFVCAEGNLILAAFYFRRKPGTVLRRSRGTVHRLAVDTRGKDVSDFCLGWCREQCRHARHSDPVIVNGG